MKIIKLTKAGSERFAMKGRNAGEEVSLPAAKANLYVSRGWATERPAEKSTK